MAVWAQYHENDGKGGLREVCGDRGVVRLDGRGSAAWQAETARTECVKRGYAAFTIIKGDSLLTARPVRRPERVAQAEEAK